MDEHGYPEATVEGFKIGMFVSYGDSGDAWVEAPDGGVGTLIWETGEPSYFKESIPSDPQGRWGTYAVQQPLPMTTDAEAAEYLRGRAPRASPPMGEVAAAARRIGAAPAHAIRRYPPRRERGRCRRCGAAPP